MAGFLQKWGQQEKSPAATEGQRQQAGTAAQQFVQARNEGNEAGFLQQWGQPEFGPAGVQNAQSWYTGANAAGQSNGWDTNFYNTFMGDWNKALNDGSARNYFSQENATGVVTWDHKSEDGRHSYKFGDIYQDGVKQGNVYDQFGQETGDLMMSDLLLDGKTKTRIFGSSERTTKLRETIEGERKNRNATFEKSMTAQEFQGDVEKTAQEWADSGAKQEAAVIGAGAAGGAATGAGAGAAIGAFFGGVGAGPGALIGGGVGAAAGALGAWLNQDTLTEQAARGYEMTKLAKEDEGTGAAVTTGIQQAGEVAMRFSSPVSNIVQGSEELRQGGLKEVGDTDSAFYATTETGERKAPVWMQVADVGATIIDSAAQFASPVTRAIYTAEMSASIGGSVGTLAVTGGKQFDYEEGKFDNIFVDDQGDFDPVSAAAGIGKIGIDVVQLTGVRGLAAAAGRKAGAIKAGEEPLEAAGFRFIRDDAGDIVGKRATASLLAPSEQVAAITTARAARVAAMKEGRAATADDFYRASQRMAAGANPVKQALVNAFGEGYEEAAQALLEPIALDNQIDAKAVATSFFYGAAAGAGMSFGATRGQAVGGFSAATDTDEVLAQQAYALHTLRTGDEQTSFEEWKARDWSQLGPTEKRVAASRNKADLDLTRDALGKVAREQAATMVASEVDAAKAIDSRRSAAERELASATNRTDPYTVITAQIAAGEMDDQGNLLRNERPATAVEASAATIFRQLTQKGQGLEEQIRLLEQRQGDGDAEAGTRLLVAQDELAAGEQIMEVVRQGLDQIYDPATDPIRQATLVDELNRFMDRTWKGENGEAAQRFITLMHSREPKLDSGSYVALQPWIAKDLTAERANNVLQVNVDILSAINGDFDGDKMRLESQLILDDEQILQARSGEYMTGPGKAVDVATRNFEEAMTRAVGEGLQATGVMNQEAVGTMQRISSILRARYDDTVIDGDTWNSVWKSFEDAVVAGDEDARTALINSLAARAGGEIMRVARENSTNEWLWIGQVVRSNFQKYQRTYRNIRDNYGLTPTEAQAVQSDKSPEGVNARKTRATTTAQTMSIWTPGTTLFRQMQKIHYTLYNSSVLSAEGSEEAGADLAEMADFYAELSRNVTRSELARTRVQDTIAARVLVMLDRLVDEMMRDETLRKTYSPAQALSLLANIKVKDVWWEGGEAFTDGQDLSLGQVLLKRALDQERQEHSKTFDTDEQMQARHARLRGLTIANKVADRRNAEATFLEIFGEVPFTDSLGGSTGSFAPNTTPNQWLRDYISLDEGQRKDREHLYKLEPEYLNRKKKTDMPYSLSEMKSGAISPYHAMLDALLATGRDRLTIAADGTVSGDMAQVSANAGAAFRDSHQSVRRALAQWRGLQRQRSAKKRTAAETIQDMFEANPGFGKAVMDLIPDESANALYELRDGELYVARWIYDMFAIEDAAEAEMFFWRNLMITQWNATQSSLREEDGEVRGRKYADLKSRFQRVMYELAQEPGQMTLELLVRQLAEAKNLDEFFRWVNTHPMIRGDRAPLLPWMDSVTDFEADAGGGWVTVSSDSDLRGAMLDLRRQAEALRSDVDFLAQRDAKDRSMLEGIKRAMRNDAGATALDRQNLQKLSTAVDRARNQPRSFGPSAMLALVRGATRGFDPNSHEKGKTAKSFGPLGEFQALIDAFGFVTGVERDMEVLTAHSMSSLRSNVGDIAKSSGLAMDADGTPVTWDALSVEKVVDLLDDSRTQNLAYTLLIPQAMDITPDGRLTDRSMFEPSLSNLLDSDSYADLFVKEAGGGLSMDRSARYLSALDALARKDANGGGGFAVLKAIIDLTVSRTSALDRVATEYDIQQLSVQAMHDVAELLQMVGQLQSSKANRDDRTLETLRKRTVQELQTQRKLRAGKKIGEITDAETVGMWVELLEGELTAQLETDRQDLIREGGSAQQIAALESQHETNVRRLRNLAEDDLTAQAVNRFAVTGDAQVDSMARVEIATYALSMANFPARAPESAAAWRKLASQQANDMPFDLSDSEWEKLSLSATGVFLADQTLAVASHVSIPAFPKGDPRGDEARFHKYWDPAYAHLADTLLSENSPLTLAASELHTIAGQQYGGVSLEKATSLIGRTLLKPYSLGNWSPAIQVQIQEAHQRIDSSASPGAIAAAGNGPKRWATIANATKRTTKADGLDGMKRTTSFGADVLRSGIDTFNVMLTAGDRELPLAMMNNRFVSRVSIGGQEISLDELNFGFTWNRENVPSGFASLSLPRLKQMVDDYAAFANIAEVDYASIPVEVDFLHPDDQPASFDWYNNVYFEGTSHTLTPDHSESLIATLWSDNGGLTSMYTQWPLDAGKKGKQAIQPYAQIDANLRMAADQAWDQDNDFGKMLRLKTEILMKRDHGFGRLDPEYYNAVYKTMKLSHIVVGTVNDVPVVMTAEEVLASQAQTGPGQPLVHNGETVEAARLVRLSPDVVRSLLGETGDQGVPRYFDDELLINPDRVQPYTGLSARAQERFIDGITAEPVGIEQTAVARRGRSKVLTVRLMQTEAEKNARDERIRVLQGEKAKVHAARASKLTGANVEQNLADVLRWAAGSIETEFSAFDFSGIGASFVGPRDNTGTQYSLNILKALGPKPRADFRNGWQVRDDGGDGGGFPGGEILVDTLDQSPADEAYRVVKDDIAFLRLGTFKSPTRTQDMEYERATKAARWLSERGATIVLSEGDGGDDLRAEVAGYLQEHGYAKLAGAKHVWVPEVFSPRYQNDRAYESTLTETEAISPSKNALIFLASDPIGADENVGILNPASYKMRDRKLLRNLIPTNSFPKYNVPVDDGRDNGMYAKVLSHLRSIMDPANTEARAELKKMGGDIDEALDRYFTKISRASSLEPVVGEELRVGDFVPFVNQANGKVILYRHGYRMPDAAKLPSMLAGNNLGVAIGPDEREPAATANDGMIVAVETRAGGGRSFAIESPLQPVGDKLIVETGGMKYIVRNPDERVFEFPAAPVFRNGMPLDLASDIQSADSKESVQNRVTDYRSALALFQTDFLPDMVEFFFPGDTDPGNEVLVYSFLERIAKNRELTVPLMEVNAYKQYGRTVATMLAQVENLIPTGVSTDWTSRLGNAQSATDQIAQAVIMYLMTPGANINNVLRTNGFSHPDATNDGLTTRKVPGVFADLLDYGVASPVHTELLRRWNQQLGDRYVLHPDWTFEVFDDKGGSTRGILQFGEVHSSGDNPLLDGQAYNPGEPAGVSAHNAMAASLSIGAITSAKKLVKTEMFARGFKKGAGITKFGDSAAEMWDMLTTLPKNDEVPFTGWRRETATETARRRAARDEIIGLYEELNRNDWSDKQKTDYQRAANNVLQALNLKGAQVALVDVWVRQQLGRPHGFDAEGNELGVISAKDALEMVNQIHINVRDGLLPTTGGNIPLMDINHLTAIYMANMDLSDRWAPRADMGKDSERVSSWDDWVRAAFGFAWDNEAKPEFHQMYLLAVDGLMHGYQNATTETRFLPVSSDALIQQQLADPANERLLVSISADENTLAEDPVAFNTGRATLETIVEGVRIYGRERRTDDPSSAMGRQKKRIERWRKEVDAPRQTRQTIRGVRGPGQTFLGRTTTTTGPIRMMMNLRVGNAMLNPALIVSAPIEAFVRRTINAFSNNLTGEGIGWVGQKQAWMSEKFADTSIGGLAELLGVAPTYTADTLAKANTLVHALSSRSDFKSMIYQELMYQYPSIPGIGKIEKALESYAKLGGRLQDPAWGILPHDLSRIYLEAVMKKVSRDPIGEAVYSVDTLLTSLGRNPKWVEENDLEAHNMGLAAIANVRSIKPNVLSMALRGVLDPLSENPSFAINTSANMVKMLVAFQNYWANAIVNWTGLQGAADMVAFMVDGKEKKLIRRMQAAARGVPFEETEAEYFDMSETLESLDLADSFIRGGVTHSALFAFGMMSGSLGLGGDDDEMKKRRALSRLQGVGVLYDPRDVENDFRNKDAIFLDWLPFGMDSMFRPQGADDDTRAMAQMNWVTRTFLSPMIGFERFYTTGDPMEIVHGFKDAMGSHPIVNETLWRLGTETYAQLMNESADAAAQDRPQDAANKAITAVGVLERMLFENAFINAIYVGTDKYDRDPYKMAALNKTGTQLTDERGNPLPSSAMEEFINENGDVQQGYISRDSTGAQWRTLSESRFGVALLGSLWTGVTGGGFASSDMWRKNMVVKTRDVDNTTYDKTTIENLILAAYTNSGQQEFMSQDEAERAIKKAFEDNGQWWDSDEVEKLASDWIARSGQTPLSIQTEAGEKLTKEGAEAIMRGLQNGTVGLDSASLDGVYISWEMRAAIQEDWISDLINEGINTIGLSREAATYRAKRIWYGGQIDDPDAVGLGDLLWSKDISFSDKTTFKQLNTTYVTGPDGRPWATGFTRDGMLGALGIKPVNRTLATVTGDVDARLNTVTGAMNTGLRALEPEAEKAPEPPKVDFDAIAAKVAEGDETSGKKGSGWTNFGRGGYYRRRGGGGRGWTDFGGGGGGVYFQEMNRLQYGTSPYGNTISFINTSNPIIRRGTINRQRFWSERGRLFQWQ